LNLLRALSTVSGMTLLSRITGLARESLKAAAFGAGLQMDAFEAAFRLPNILRRLFAEGAFSQAFVPIAEYRRQRGPKKRGRSSARRHAARRRVLGLVDPRGRRRTGARLCAGSGFAQTPARSS
jgi:putative peptidoglycan lipid II flippase